MSRRPPQGICVVTMRILQCINILYMRKTMKDLLKAGLHNMYNIG